MERNVHHFLCYSKHNVDLMNTITIAYTKLMCHWWYDRAVVIIYNYVLHWQSILFYKKKWKALKAHCIVYVTIVRICFLCILLPINILNGYSIGYMLQMQHWYSTMSWVYILLFLFVVEKHEKIGSTTYCLLLLLYELESVFCE